MPGRKRCPTCRAVLTEEMSVDVFTTDEVLAGHFHPVTCTLVVYDPVDPADIKSIQCRSCGDVIRG